MWLEGSALGEAMRGMGVWGYGVINLTHILGISTLFGSILILDLRLLGLWRRLPPRALAGPTLSLAVLGFSIAAVSGICMLSTNALDYAGNPFLLIKFPAIALGLINALALSFSPAWQRVRDSREALPGDQGLLAFAAGTSLVSWLAAVSAGRMIGYW